MKLVHVYGGYRKKVAYLFSETQCTYHVSIM